MTNWQAGFVQSGALRLHYQRAGQGVPLLLVHGRTDNAACWQAFAEPLTHHYDVVMYDARGHGLSDQPAAHYAPHDLARVTTDHSVERDRGCRGLDEVDAGITAHIELVPLDGCAVAGLIDV
ncbi:MAG: alpha/beta fold hydrolase [Betaproteobacteria bacterium]|nr:alpha/beta fold hydrolase [Betaproteobacteria bacterium]